MNKRKVRSIAFTRNQPENLQAQRNNVKHVKLRSDVKKTTSLVRRLRLISEDTVLSLIQDCEKFNLTRYLTEIIDCFTEETNLIKIKDCFFLAQVFSCIHLRYEDFSRLLLDRLTLACEDNMASTEHMAVYFRLFTEVTLFGIFKDAKCLLDIYHKLVFYGSTSKPNSSNAGFTHHKAILSFIKKFKYDFFNRYSDFDNTVIPFDLDLKQKFERKSYLYHKYVCERLQKEFLSYSMIGKKNKSELLSRGSISERNQTITTAKNQLIISLKQLNELLSSELSLTPLTLEPTETKANSKFHTLSLWDREHDSKEISAFLYGGEEYRVFYQDLPDLPAMLSVEVLSTLQTKTSFSKPQDNQLLFKKSSDTKDNSKQSKRGLSNASKGNLDQALDLFGHSNRLELETNLRMNSFKKQTKANKAKKFVKKLKAIDPDKIIFNEEDAEDDIFLQDRNASIISNEIRKRANEEDSKEDLNIFFERLVDCTNKELCDDFCIDFCNLFARLRSEDKKIARGMLKDKLRIIPWDSFDIICYYARIVASLSIFFTDVVSQIVESLIRSFKYLILKNDIRRNNDKLDYKIKCARYLGELIKFKSQNLNQIFPAEKIFFVFNFTLQRFTGSNINFICELLETAGKFLFRNIGTKPVLCDILKRLTVLMQEKVLDGNQRTQLHNVIISSRKKDDSVKALIIKTKTRENLYLEYLLRNRLARFEDVDFVLQKLLKFNWDSDFEGTSSLFLKVILKVNKICYSRLPLLANVVKKLCTFYPQFHVLLTLSLVDDLFAAIKKGYHSDTNFQKTIAQGIFFAELYNKRVLSTSCFFDTLYFLLHDGHDVPVACCRTDFNLSSLDPESKTDPPLSIIRIVLICQILSHLGSFAKQGIVKKNVENFWKYLERYAWFKISLNQELHFEVNSILNETIYKLRVHDLTKPLHPKSQKRNRTALDTIRFQRNELAALRSIQNRPKNYEEALQQINISHDISDDCSDLLEEINEEFEPNPDLSQENISLSEEDDTSVAASSESYKLSDDDEILDTFNFEKQAEKSFEQELKNLLKYNVDQIKLNKKVAGESTNNMAIPLNVLRTTNSESISSVKLTPDKEKFFGSPQSVTQSSVKFRMLKRDVKGRVETKDVYLPKSSQVVQASRKDGKLEQEEHAKLKKYVLQYEERERFYQVSERSID